MKITLSDGEWKLMDRLWEEPGRTIAQLTAALRESTGWEKHTIITMLSRLEAKGAVTHTQETPKRFSPALARSDAQLRETESFLDKVYKGRLGLLVNAMVDSQALTQEDLDELTAILEKAKGGEGK